MLIDGGNLGADSDLRAEIAVVGAGPVGIVVALELARSGHSVLLIESGNARSGGSQPDSEVITGDPFHVPMSLATRRQLGGATNMWGGRCVPFDPIDFETRTIVPGQWPLAYEDISPFFQRVCDWCKIGNALFDADQVAELRGRALVPGLTNGHVRATALERWSLPTNFGREYADALRRSPKVTVVTNLTCVEIVCDPCDRTVDHLEARTSNGKRVAIKASQYVIACGGLETTRLLFASNRVHPEGLGNHSGHLGRWYMAHVESRIAQVHFTTAPSDTIYGYERDAAGVYVRRRFTFSTDFLLEHKLPNSALWLINPTLSDPSHRSEILSFVYLMLVSPLGKRFVAEGIRQYHIKSTRSVVLRDHLLNVIRGVGPAARFAVVFAYQRYLKRGRKVPGFFVPSATNVYPLDYHAEHLPSYDSYVVPVDERDSFGVPRLRTHLVLSDDDVDGALRAHDYLDRYLRQSGLGHVEFLYRDLRQVIRSQFFGGYHQAGTTRMSARREDGVVDSDLAVHGFRDLHVASSSAFVTSGQANSTFMILALALRLVEHLRTTLASGLGTEGPPQRPRASDVSVGGVRHG